MPQKAYKRRQPRAQKGLQRQKRLQREQVARAFKVPSDMLGGPPMRSSDEPIMVMMSPERPNFTRGARVGRVMSRGEIEALAASLGTPAMHVFFYDPRIRHWLWIEWPEPVL